MAQRFGGKYSPDGEAQSDHPQRGGFDNATVDPVDFRVNLLFLPPVLMLLFALNDGAIGLVLGIGGAGILTLAVWLLREGLRAEAAYHTRRVAKRPALPRKILAGLLTGIGAGIAAYKADPGLVAPLLYTLVCGGLHLTAFGIDPLKDKGMDGDTLQHGRVARAVNAAEATLAEMAEAAARSKDRKLEARVERFQATARDLFRTVEEDPRDLAAGRKYLTVYLQGARDATVKFADLHAKRPDPAYRADYMALLDDLEQNFAARTSKLLLDDHSDLTVEIEVLRERLQRDGLRS